jgi:hypothetical protein
MPKNDNSENKQQVENLTKALAVYAAKQELVVEQKKANDDAAETHDIVVDNQKKAKRLDPTVKKTAKPIPVAIQSDESEKDVVPDLKSEPEPMASSGNEYVDKLGKRADKSAGRVDDVKSAKNKLALMEAEDEHNKKWGRQLKMKADAEALAADPAGFLKKILLEKMLIAFSAKARAQAKVDKDDERLAAAEAAAKRKSDAQALHDIVDGTADKEKEITEHKKESAEIDPSKKESTEIDPSKDESIGTALSANPDATFDDPLTELNSSGEEQVDLLKTQTALLEKLVSSSEDDSRTSAAEELVNEAKDKDGKGKGLISVAKDKKDKATSSLSGMFGPKSSFGKMFGKKGGFGKMLAGMGASKMPDMLGKSSNFGKMFSKRGGFGKAFGKKGPFGKKGGFTKAFGKKGPFGKKGGMMGGKMGGKMGGMMGGMGNMAAKAGQLLTKIPPQALAAAAAVAAVGAGGYMLYDKMRGSDESKAALDEAENLGAVEHNIFGDSVVLDWERVKGMSPKAIQDLADYDDWDSETEKGFDDILNPKSTAQEYKEGADQEAKATEDMKKLESENANRVVGDDAGMDKTEFENKEVQSEYDELATLRQEGRKKKKDAIKAETAKMVTESTGAMSDEEMDAEGEFADSRRGRSEKKRAKASRDKEFLENEGVASSNKYKNKKTISSMAENNLKAGVSTGGSKLADYRDYKDFAQNAPDELQDEHFDVYNDESLAEEKEVERMSDKGVVSGAVITGGAEADMPGVEDMAPTEPLMKEEGDSNFVKSAKMAYDRTALGGLTNMFGLTTSEDDKATGKKSDIFNRLSGTTEEGKDESTLAEKAYDYTPMGLMTNMLGWTTSEADKEKQGEMPEGEEMPLGEMPEGEAGSDIPKRFDYKKIHAGFMGRGASKKRADFMTSHAEVKFIKQQNLQKSQGLDQMNQTALNNKTAGVAQGTTPAQPTSNITTDNSVVNNNNIAAQESHDRDPTARFLNRNNPMNDSF